MIERIAGIIYLVLLVGTFTFFRFVYGNSKLQNLSRRSWWFTIKTVAPIAFFFGISYALWVIAGLTMHDECAFPTDQARVAYETMSIASYGTAMIVASTVVFLPLLTLIWTTAKHPLVNHLDQLALLERNTESTTQKQTIEGKINQLRYDVDLITRHGLRWRFLYRHAMLDIVFIIVAFGYMNLVRMEPLDCYRAAFVLNGLAAGVFLLLLTLWGIFQVLIRPIVLKYEGTQWRILGK